MKVIVCGGAGLIGHRLSSFLLESGYEVIVLDRNRSRIESPKLHSFPVNLLRTEDFDRSWFEGVSAVVNLSGKDVLKLWTEEYKKAIWESRVTVNERLVDFMSTLDSKPTVFVSASAVGYYGDTGDREIDENTPAGEGFLADVCVAWERAARRAETLGMRSVQVRTAPVLSSEGGFLQKLTQSMKFGLTVRFGEGSNWFPWIHMQDLVQIYELTLRETRLSGPVNACAPGFVRFRELLDLVRRYRKAVVLPLPVALFRMVSKELAEELTHSQKIFPAKLRDVGFRFRYGALAKALEDVFGRMGTGVS